MAVKSLQDLNRLNPCRNRICKQCGLYLNQLPIFDKAKKAQVFWVGLSAVQFDEHEKAQPLSPITASGGLIRKIEQPFDQAISFYKTNIVKCVPLKDEKIRYPLQHEMQKCFPNFEAELELLNPSIVFLLGKQVAKFVIDKLSDKNEITLDENFNYGSITISNVKYVPVHHPSYVLVYKRKQLDLYTSGIQKFFKDIKSSSRRMRPNEVAVCS